MTPIIDVFTPADTARLAHLTTRVRRLTAENTRLRQAVADLDERLDMLTRANAGHESPRFAVRSEVTA